MRFDVLTLFPEIPAAFFETSIMAKAVERGLINYSLVNIRDFAYDKHRTCDDLTYGGGAGMLMQAEPIYEAFSELEKKDAPTKVIYCSPRGRIFSQKIAEELARESHIAFLCGHYEGVDQRALELLNAEELSLGDYVLSGGELACAIMMDAISRVREGVLNKKESYEEESFSNGLLEYPQYTRPREYKGLTVPDVLLSGDHKKISAWRHEESLKLTEEVRPDLYQLYRERNPEEFQPKKKRRK